MDSRQKLEVHVRTLGKKPTIAQKNDLSERRRRLKVRVERFQRQARSFMSLSAEDDMRLVLNGDETDDGDNSDSDSNSGSDDELWKEFLEDQAEKPVESVHIILPSALTFADRQRLKLGELTSQEIQL